MTYDQYWRGDPYDAVLYRKADEYRRRRKNEELWLQGLYVYDAFTVVMANAFRKKGAKAAKYPEKPYDIFPKTKEEKEEEQKREQEKIRRSLENMRLAWIEKHKGKAAKE